MATTNYNWNLPTVGGSEDTWGTQLNANWSALDTLLGGVTALEFSRLDGVSGNIQTQIDGKQAADADLTAIAALTPLDGRFIVGNGTTWVAESGSTALASLGVTATATEINYLSGATSNIQNQINTLVAGQGNIPSGGIIMWSGSVANIPSGWFLCNGSNGTPNLQDRFIVGAGSSYAPGATGGADSVTLSASQIPAHTHSFSGTTSSAGDHAHAMAHYATNGSGDGLGPGSGCCGGARIVSALSTETAGSHSHSFSGTTGSAGSGASHENRPPYYALAFIMKA